MTALIVWVFVSVLVAFGHRSSVYACASIASCCVFYVALYMFCLGVNGVYVNVDFVCVWVVVFSTFLLQMHLSVFARPHRSNINMYEI